MTVEFFDSTEDMFERIEQNVAAAQIRASEAQNKLTYGDYWMRIWEDILIFGRITPEDELWGAEADLGASPEEIEEERSMMAGSYAQGFRFGRAYSVVVPEGELGDTHVSDMIPITEEEFNQSKDLKWIPEEIGQLPWFNRSLLERI